MSNIDLSSLESEHEADTNQYTDIEEVYGIDVFANDTTISTKVDDSKLFLTKQNQSKTVDTSNLFIIEKKAPIASNQEPTTHFDFSLVIVIIIVLTLVILLFRRLTRNEYPS